MAFERVARTPTAEESVVKVVEPQRETTVVDETIKRTERILYEHATALRIPYQKTTYTYTQGKGGAHNNQKRERKKDRKKRRKKNRNPSLGLY